MKIARRQVDIQKDPLQSCCKGSFFSQVLHVFYFQKTLLDRTRELSYISKALEAGAPKSVPAGSDQEPRKENSLIASVK